MEIKKQQSMQETELDHSRLITTALPFPIMT